MLALGLKQPEFVELDARERRAAVEALAELLLPLLRPTP